jgi:hypothetical protein
MSEREVKKEDVRAFIDDAWGQIGQQLSEFNGEALKGMQKIEVGGKTLFKFTVKSSLGSLHCLYEPEELVSSLLKETEYSAALIWFMSFLNKLPFSVLICSENAGEAATVKSLEVSSAFEIEKNKGKKGAYTVAVKERRKVALKKMKQGNEMLVGANTSGPDKKLSLYTIGIAIEMLKRDGRSPDMITPGAVGMRLGCDGKSVSKFFERKGGSFKDLLEKSFGSDNQTKGLTKSK